MNQAHFCHRQSNTKPYVQTPYSTEERRLHPDQIKRSYNADGQSKEEGRLLPAFYLYQMDLASPPASFGDNQLGVCLTKSVGQQKLDVQQVQVKVEVKMKQDR